MLPVRNHKYSLSQNHSLHSLNGPPHPHHTGIGLAFGIAEQGLLLGTRGFSTPGKKSQRAATQEPWEHLGKEGRLQAPHKGWDALKLLKGIQNLGWAGRLVPEGLLPEREERPSERTIPFRERQWNWILSCHPLRI